MKKSPGFLMELQKQLESIPLEELEKVNRPGGFEVADLLDAVLNPKDHTVYMPYPVDDDTVVSYTAATEYLPIGEKAVLEGRVAYCILAGGAGTRIGRTKGLLALKDNGPTLLDLKINAAPQGVDIWVMTSPANDEEVVTHLKRSTRRVKTFKQYESFCLTPDNQIAIEGGSTVLRPCGHGDVVPALVHSGVLNEFVSRGGKYVYVSNVDNVLGSLDLAVLGLHIAKSSPVTCEVTTRTHDDTGGVLCNHGGFNQIVEQFRLSHPVDSDQFPHLNTNTMVFNADLDFSTLKSSWHRVKKSSSNKLLVHHERLLQDLTATFQTQYVEVPREARFLPVKTIQDLQAAARILGDKET